MTVRNLKYFFAPSSVVLVGASDEPGSLGHVAACNLLNGGFPGEVALISQQNEIEGRRTYRRVDELPHAFDLALLALPEDAVPTMLRSLAEQGTRAAIVFSTASPRGAHARSMNAHADMLRAAQPFLMRIIGPDALGVISSPAQLNASYAPLYPHEGRLAFIAQSGATMTAVADWAMARGIGFSRLISLGEMADVDTGDLLDYLAVDPETRAILLYLREVTHARKFMSAARAAARLKPVIVLRGGRFHRDEPVASSPIAQLVDPDSVFDAAFRRAGMLRVHSLETFFDAVQTLAHTPRIHGERLAILGNGYNTGLLAADALVAAGGQLAELSAATRNNLDKALSRQWWGENPVHLAVDADAGHYSHALETLLDAPEVDVVAVLHCPSALSSGLDIARAVSRIATRYSPRVLTNWLGGEATRASRQHFADAQIPTFDTPERAVAAFLHLVEYRHNQAMLMETPPSIPRLFEPRIGIARHVIQAALDCGREWLDEAEARDVLKAYGIETVDTLRAADAEEVRRCVARIGGPVAVKILSPDVHHKSDVGGVTLGVTTPAGAAVAATAMAERLQRLRPNARLTGFVVQPMAGHRGAFELIAGIVNDATFGPVLFFGEGGIATEALADIATALPPLNLHLARELIERTRVHRRLQGVRSQPPADVDAIALALVQIGQIAADLAEVVDLVVNPLMADGKDILALDARIRIRRCDARAADRLAIRPYPSELEREFVLADDSRAWLRPIRPEDEPAIVETFRRMDTRERYFRFFASLAELPHSMAARLTQIDYDREMAWVLTSHEPPGRAPIYAVARLTAEPDNERAEFALTVRGDHAGQGLGTRLMEIILDYARERGIGEVYGEVLRENHAMLRVCEKLGFESRHCAGEMGVVHVRKKTSG